MRYYILVFFSFFHVALFSQVVAEGDTVLCDGLQGEIGVTLTATSYAVDLTDANIYTDDIFGSVVDLGFDFEFYGNTYNQVVLSSNNYLSFNTANAGGYSGWAINAAVPNNFDAPMNAILCPWQDIYPGANGNGTIQYATIGEAPNRVFIASFCGIPMFSCTDICYSSQIKLFETTNVVETHIAEKVLCTTWNGGVAIHALHNSDGSIAHVVTGLDGVERNYPNQWTCQNDGWSFTPNGSNDYIIQNIEFEPAVAGTDIIWQDEFGNEIGTGGEIVVFPTDDITYTAGASLCGDAGDWCGFEGGIEGDDVSISFEAVSITGVDIVNAPCDNPTGGSAMVFIDGSGPFTYSWLNDQGNEISTSSASLGSLTSGVYTFTISTLNGCEETVEVFIDTDGEVVSEALLGEDIETCETSINLSANLPLIGETGFWNLVSGQGEISDISNADISVTNLGFGDNVFEWSLENECGISSDQIVVTVLNGVPTISPIENIFCLDPIPLSVNIQNEEGFWSVNPSEGVIILDPFSVNTSALVEDYGTYVFTFEGCNGVDSEIVEVNTMEPILNGPDEVMCLDTFQLSADVPGDQGFWEFIGPGNVQFNNNESINPMVTVDTYGMYEFIYYGCGTSTSIWVNMLNPTPQIEDPGIVYCTFETEVIANSSFDGTWSVGDIQENTTMSLDPNENTVLVSVNDYGVYNIVFTACGVSDTLELTFTTVEPYIVVSDHQNCIFSIELNAMTPDPNAGPWEQISGPSFAEILNPYSTTTQATVSEYGLYVFSFTSCDDVDEVEIGVSCPMTIPNSFSPNGDGVNDVFEIPDLNPNVHTQSVLYIYNKWGTIIYINPNYGLNGEWWDGQTTYHDKPLSSFIPEHYYDKNANYVTDGIYYYTLEVYNNAHHQKEFYSGDIAIFSQDK